MSATDISRSAKPFHDCTAWQCCAELKRVGGEELPDGDGIQLHGWRVQSRKAPILSELILANPCGA